MTVAEPITVVPMRRRHIRAVMEIDARVYPQPWSRQLYVDSLADEPGRFHVVATSGRTVVGHGGLMFVEPDAHITTVAVDPDLQGAGIGSWVVAALLRHAIARGLDAMTLEVRAGNHAAQGIYRRFGFAPVGTRPRYYRDRTGQEDAIIMWLHDIQTAGCSARLDRIEAELPDSGRVDPAVVAVKVRS